MRSALAHRQWIMWAAGAVCATAASAAAPPVASRPAFDDDPSVRRLMRGVPLTYFHAIGRDLARELRLPDDQVAALAAVVDAHQQAATADRRTVRRIRMKQSERRAAQDAGDERRVGQLDAEIAELAATRTAYQALGDPRQAFFDEVEDLLPLEHAPRIEAFRVRLLDRKQYGNRIRQLLDTLPGTLELDAAQQAQFDRLREALRTELASPGWNVAPLDGVDADIQAAEERGEYEQADRLKAALYAEQPDRLARLEKFFADISQTLNESQQAKLMSVRQAVIQDAHAPQFSVRMLLRAARRIDLTAAQRDELRTIENEMMRAVRAARAANEDDRPVSVETRRRIEALLTAEQKSAFDETLAAFDRGGRGH